jgi:cell division protein FtsX
MQTLPKHQRGLTFISLCVLLFIFGFFVFLILKIGPIYLDHNKVASALANLKKDPAFPTMTEQEIRRSLDNRFNIGYVDFIDSEDITISKSNNYVKVEIDYEVLKPMAYNLSVLVEFHDMIETGGDSGV